MASADLEKGDLIAPGQSPNRRAQALQRLQVGGAGLGVILLVVAIASVVIERAQEVEQTAVAEAKLDTPEPTETAASDPLAEIGVVPSPEPAATTPAPISNPSAKAKARDAEPALAQ